MNVDLTGMLLAQVTTYGTLALGLMMLLRGLGLPLPTGLVVIASGALARSGQIEWPAAALAAFGGVVLGDVGSYLLGRYAGGRLRQRLSGNRADAWDRAQDWIQRQGSVAVLATRSALTVLDAPVSWVAGSSRYGLRHFFTWDLVGRLGWLAFHSGLGYAFGGQWPAISLAIQDHTGWVAGLAALGPGGYLAWRMLRRRTVPSSLPG